MIVHGFLILIAGLVSTSGYFLLCNPNHIHSEQEKVVVTHFSKTLEDGKVIAHYQKRERSRENRNTDVFPVVVRGNVSDRLDFPQIFSEIDENNGHWVFPKIVSKVDVHSAPAVSSIEITKEDRYEEKQNEATQALLRAHLNSGQTGL